MLEEAPTCNLPSFSVLPKVDETIEPTPVPKAIGSSPVPKAIAPISPKQFSKKEIRSSLQASTLDGVFAAIFSSITCGVLITNFLLALGASSIEIGLLSSIPMLGNCIQPIGAYLANRTNSRHNYGLWVFGLSRSLWLVLLFGIARSSWFHTDQHQLILGTLLIVLATHVLNGLGGASWMAWMAALVPHRLRGRYFGFRNGAANLTNLIGVPLMGLAVSRWGGAIKGFGIILIFGIVAGFISLSFQFFMSDVNPQAVLPTVSHKETTASNWYKDRNFLTFLIYFGLWTFALNLSAPFFNIYMLDNLGLDVSWVTLYSSLNSGANLLMLFFWGRLADRLGNRPLLILVGVLVAATPVLWLFTGTDTLSIWLWLPLVHIAIGGTWAAIDLCSNNIQLEIAPAAHSANYFAIAAAIAGITGAVGTMSGGFLAQYSSIGGLAGLFILSALLRLVALLPLFFVREKGSSSVGNLVRSLLPAKLQPILLPVAESKKAPEIPDFFV